MDASTSSTHMPRSIFPDIPASRRAATITPNYADTGHSSPAPPPLNTRRHTTQFLPTRREARPLRSSPLAGPSLALTQDGILAVSEAEKKLAASKSASHSEAYAGDAVAESSATEVTSPTSECSSSGHALSAPEPHTRTEPAPDGSMSSRIRRLSLGFKRKSFQAPPAQSDSTPQPRRASSSSSHSHSQEDAPPVPQLPQWARGAVKRSVTEPSTPTDQHTHRQSHHPRRSTSPTMPTSDPVKVARRTSLLPSQLPNTSRNPEENWMTSASAPRFSRLSLKADGVVMPVSVKEARRRSTASLSSRMSASDVRGLKGKQSTRSLRSVHPASETAKRLAEDAEMQPPRPLFRGDSNASSSSLGSSITDTDSILTETRSISRMSSMTDGELPLPHGYAEEGKSTSTLELRINDVTIDMINYEHMEHVESPRSFTEMELATIAEVEAREVKGVSETGVETAVVDSPTPTKVKRRGTLKKVWKRVVRSVTG